MGRINLTLDPLKTSAPSLEVNREFDPERLLRSMEKALFDRGVLLLEPTAALSLAGSVIARASGFGEDPPPPYVVSGEVATLDITGPLYQRSIAMCGFTLADGYDAIAARARAAFNDPTSGAVLLAIDSAGGDVAGVMELIAALDTMSEESGKPIVSYLNERAASAGYWIASAGSSVVVPRTGEAGSIGAIVMGLNQRGALDAKGVRAVVAAYPAGKASSFNAVLAPPDSPEATAGFARMQARAEEVARLFAADAAQRRGLTLEAVLGLDAAMFGGARAVEAGLADHVGGRAMAMDLARSKIKRKVYSMTDGKQTDAQSRAARALLPLLAIGGLATEGPAAAPEAVEAAARETERLATLGKALEASTGQRGPAALEVTAAWRDGAARVPALERRVKIEALQGRLANVYPPAERFALAPTLTADNKPHPRAGLPDPSAGPHERFDTLSLDVFDARTSTGTVHPALGAAPKPAMDNDAKWRAEAMAKGVDPATYIQAQLNIRGAL